MRPKVNIDRYCCLGNEIKYLFRLVSIPVVGEILASQVYTTDVKKFGNGLRSVSINATYITDELIENLYRIEENPTQYKTTLKILRTCVNWMGQKKSLYAPVIQRLPSITSPTLVIWGRQDDGLPLNTVNSLPKACQMRASKRLTNAGTSRCSINQKPSISWCSNS